MKTVSPPSFLKLNFELMNIAMLKKSIKNLYYFAKFPNKGTAFATKNIIMLNPIHKP